MQGASHSCFAHLKRFSGHVVRTPWTAVCSSASSVLPALFGQRVCATKKMICNTSGLSLLSAPRRKTDSGQTPAAKKRAVPTLTYKSCLESRQCLSGDWKTAISMSSY
ncbi:hypothetical protein BU25DRAFT_160615 [Macroventuria anomochaeta]|uniref:Uncharacterized protein n=1 Tax=Macroventuria anomochaeta TaxID=301207 RepID=A0ACB6RTC8_9PLEO|nr:uncharacterized protein BU25DRAFT_160615 [Macroventuria anomochaeta]KAF2624389.1 hypothetical protein BU25DRAFT_160615 [Macroventuria anomochaeta]